MKIPKDMDERRALYRDLVRACSVSRQERFEFYKQLRNYYLFGTADTSGTHYNKIGSTVETLCSFIYAPDSARFSIHLGSAAPKVDIAKVPALAHEVNDQWRMGRNHLTFGIALKWSLVFGCVLLKGLWKRDVFRSYLVEPHQFGVLREDVPVLEDQEAFCHFYTSTKTNLETELIGNPRQFAIMSAVNSGALRKQDGDDTLASPGLSRLTLSAGIALGAASGSIGGAVDGGLQGPATVQYEYAPKVEAELVDMVELYVWDDDAADYQMVTMVNPDVLVYDRRQVGPSGTSPFVRLSPELTLYDYFWGDSFVAKLTRLQEMRTDRVNQIEKILAKQADPPFWGSGLSGIAEEKLQGLRSAGGIVSANMPGAKIDTMAPTMPANIFAELDQIDKMFDDQAGIGHILQGKGESGVRSKGQADLLARLGSARPKSRAIVVEEAAEDVATLLLRNVQEHSKQRFEPVDIPGVESTGPGGEKKSEGGPLLFIAAQFTNDYEVRVDAHSSSPIFVEDRKNDASTLFESKAIDRSTLLEMFDPPNVQLLQEKLKGIEAKEAEQAAREAQAAATQQGAKK